MELGSGMGEWIASASLKLPEFQFISNELRADRCIEIARCVLGGGSQFCFLRNVEITRLQESYPELNNVSVIGGFAGKLTLKRLFHGNR